MTALQKTAAAPAVNQDRHGTSDVLNRYIDQLLTEGKRKVIDERNTAVKDLTGQWNRNISDIVGKRNAEIEALKKNMPNSQTSFTTGAGLTAGGYGLGRLAALSKHIGKARGNRAGMIGAGLTAGGVMLKDKLMPSKAKLPSVVPDRWVDPSQPQLPKPDPTLWQRIKNLVGAGDNKGTEKWVTDKKYPSMIPGGTPKPQPKPQIKPPEKTP